MTDTSIRIGCASGFWGDTNSAAFQLVEKGQLNYLVFDYLAEITLSIMAGAKRKNPALGYATDFVTDVMSPLAKSIQQQGIKVISNAGGINPQACADALAEQLEQQGISLNIAVVTGDDLTQTPQLEEQLSPELDSQAPLPKSMVSANAYLGAKAITAALAQGADIVITGRIVDSAVTLAPLMHEFNWQWDQYDKLAQGSLAGHILECGAQSTGGNFTDWEQVPSFDNIGFPIAECFANGEFVIQKPEHTGGLVSPLTVAEQIVYEIGDPGAYYLPDVICDFCQVQLHQEADNKIRVSGAKGYAPTPDYKVSVTYLDGFRANATFIMAGIDVAAKAKRTTATLITKINRQLEQKGVAPLTTQVDLLGTESSYGANAQTRHSREIVVRIAAIHPDKRALFLFGKEIAQAATGMAPGITGLLGGRPKPTPVIKLHSALIAKSSVTTQLGYRNETILVEKPLANEQPLADSEKDSFSSSARTPELHSLPALSHQVPLIQLAVARSGDKGDHANIGVIARHPEFLPYIENALTTDAVAKFFQHCLTDEKSDVLCWQLPGLNAVNFLLKHSLGGGGVASLRSDPQGKAFAQQLLEFPVPISAALWQTLNLTSKE
ncbi:acyclic terpene utilization AtuA family protein [Pleionea sp. CnH1-48]|uniref:acyclic terpene utilization AtuA family protein n=1 Tax=Pleionea sp. CnH1-48 TaxID=2954494 RepID=UPI002097320D|nr:acyclic terpene utilization AtuA family protein [Pleionea sp. CnH1-48]MCO7227286.1 DUF1446 domain-containing protein [Pleionea sp. CnH1-48]